MDDMQRACEIIERLLEWYGSDQVPQEEWEDATGEAVAFLAMHKQPPDI